MSHQYTVKKVKQKQMKPTRLLEQSPRGHCTSRGVQDLGQTCVFRQQEHTGGKRMGKYTGKVCQLGQVQFGKNSPACSPGFFLSASLINAN